MPEQQTKKEDEKKVTDDKLTALNRLYNSINCAIEMHVIWFCQSPQTIGVKISLLLNKIEARILTF